VIDENESEVVQNCRKRSSIRKCNAAKLAGKFETLDEGSEKNSRL
jgi:hypothetical protein